MDHKIADRARKLYEEMVDRTNIPASSSLESTRLSDVLNVLEHILKGDEDPTLEWFKEDPRRTGE